MESRTIYLKAGFPTARGVAMNLKEFKRYYKDKYFILNQEAKEKIGLREQGEGRKEDEIENRDVVVVGEVEKIGKKYKIVLLTPLFGTLDMWAELVELTFKTEMTLEEIKKFLDEILKEVDFDMAKIVAEVRHLSYLKSIEPEMLLGNEKE